MQYYVQRNAPSTLKVERNAYTAYKEARTHAKKPFVENTVTCSLCLGLSLEKKKAKSE